jgi:hypothetical protein
VNPTKLAFSHTDFSVTTRYEVGYFYSGATTPFQTVSVPKSAVSPSGVEYITNLPRPAFGTFTAKMVACANATPTGEMCSDWSNATEVFSLAPFSPVVRILP